MASRNSPWATVFGGPPSSFRSLVAILTMTFSFLLPCPSKVLGSNRTEAKALVRARAALAAIKVDRASSVRRWKEERARLDAEAAALEERLERLTLREGNKEESAETIRDQTETLYQKADRLSRTDREDGQRRQALAELLGRQARALRDRIGLAPPHGSRSQRVNAMDIVLARMRTGPERLDLQFEALMQLLRQELSVMNQVELLSARIADSRGIIRPCEILRFGITAAVFRSRDGSSYGAMVRGHEDGAGCGWIRELGWLSRRNIDAALAQARLGVRALVRIPVDVSQRMTVRAVPKSQSLLQTLRGGGPVMIPLLLLALVAGVLVLARWWFLRREERSCRRMGERLLALRSEGQWDRIEAEVDGEVDLVSAIARGGLSRKGQPIKIVEEGMEAAILRRLPVLEQAMRGISVLAAVAPLLGLLGTVTGMISTFDVITLHGTGDPRILAGGISEALITTETGLIIAIPLLLLHRYLRGRIDRIVARAQEIAFELAPGLAAGAKEDA